MYRDGVQYIFKRNSSECSVWMDEKCKSLQTFNIAREMLYNWLWLEKNEEHLKPKTGYQKGHSHGIKDLDEFREFISLHADYTQEEMASNYGVCSSIIGRVLKKLWYSRKKSQTYMERSKEKREVYAVEIKALKFEKLVFVDDSGMNDNHFYPYAYSVIGKRHYEAYFGHYKKRISMIGGLCKRKFI